MDLILWISKYSLVLITAHLEGILLNNWAVTVCHILACFTFYGCGIEWRKRSLAKEHDGTRCFTLHEVGGKRLLFQALHTRKPSTRPWGSLYPLDNRWVRGDTADIAPHLPHTLPYPISRITCRIPISPPISQYHYTSAGITFLNPRYAEVCTWMLQTSAVWLSSAFLINL